MLIRDPLTKAKHFHDRARERLQFAARAQTSTERHHHLTLLQHYLLMGEAEMEEASRLLARRLHGTKTKNAAKAA